MVGMFTKCNVVFLSIFTIVAGFNPQAVQALSLVSSLPTSVETEIAPALDTETIVAAQLSILNSAPVPNTQKEAIVFDVSSIIAELAFTNSFSFLRSVYLPLTNRALLNLPLASTMPSKSNKISVHGCTVALRGGAEWCKREEASQF